MGVTTKKWKDVRRPRKSEADEAADRAWVRNELLQMTLRELREEVGETTQKDLAEKIDMSQGELSKLENRDDHLLSTLRNYVEALGGELEVVAVFQKGRKRITLQGV